MANIKVSGENPFRVNATSFCIGQTSGGYTLNYSADGKTFTEWEEATEADVDMVVANAAKGMIYKLVGNTDEKVVVTF